MNTKLAIRFLDKMGSDRSIAETARVCTAREAKELNVGGTINQLIRDKHWSPFEQACIQYELDVPLFVAEQWKRHHQKLMQRSLRYTKNPQLFTGNSEVSFSTMVGAKPVEDYEELLGMGTRPEDARRILPAETMTRCRFVVDLRTALNMLNQRLDSHAQSETQEVAKMFLQMLNEHFPLSVNAFLKYRYQEFTVESGDLRKILYLLDDLDFSGAKDPTMEVAIRRFVDNGKKRIGYIREARSLLDAGTKNGKAGGERTWRQQELGL